MRNPTKIPTRFSFIPNVKRCLCSSLTVSLAFTDIGASMAAEAAVEEMVVTGSRIRMTSGMETPNPVTVVTVNELQLYSPGLIGDALAQLPQFQNSSTSENQGNFYTAPSAGSVNLRGLSSNRTLNLIDGRHIVPSNLAGNIDTNLFPQSIMTSIETVTGGASAAYGTDAVAGVVNFILDTNFVGYKANVQMGANYNGDNKNSTVSFSGGWAIGERGHLLLSADKYEQDAVIGYDDYDWYTQTSLLPRTNADLVNGGLRGSSPENSYYAPYQNVVSRTTSLDSVIHFWGPASALGSYDVDQNGNAAPWVLGDVYDNSTQSIVNGGSGSQGGEERPYLQGDTGRQNLFLYGDYDLTDNLNVFAQAMHGEADTKGSGGFGYFSSAFTSRGNRGIDDLTQFLYVYSGNPYLPSNIQNLMTANNVDSVRLGRRGSIEDLSRDAYNYSENTLDSVTLGFKYSVVTDGFFNDWVVDGYYQSGENEASLRQDNGTRVDRIAVALDAVVDGNGNVVCNVNYVGATDAYSDCVPFNPFGRGNASDAAIDWVTGFEPGQQITTNGWQADGSRVPYSYTSSTGSNRLLINKQKVAEVSANGEIFSGFGAGAVGMALGGSYRKESFVQLVQVPGGYPPNHEANPSNHPVQNNDPAMGIRGARSYDVNNSTALQDSKIGFGGGAYNVRELFTEFRVPLLADVPFARQMNLALAARWADYAGSGEIWSWKAGLEWAVNDDVRLRGTISQDARAASLAERFEFNGSGNTITDHEDADNRINITAIRRGNPNVTPEDAKTITYGVVYQPSFVEGLSGSIDYYDVRINDYIDSGDPQLEVDNCFYDGVGCDLIERNGPPLLDIDGNPRGLNTVTLVNTLFTNFELRETSGIDLELAYRFPVELFGGRESVALRFLASKILTTSQVKNGIENSRIFVGFNGYNEWTSTLSGSYSRGDFTASLNARYTSDVTRSPTEGDLQPAAIYGNNVYFLYPTNTIKTPVLVNARFGYSFEAYGSNVNAYLSINNLFNADPDVYLSPASAISGADSGVFGQHSKLGRRFALGFNLDF